MLLKELLQSGHSLEYPQSRNIINPWNFTNQFMINKVDWVSLTEQDDTFRLKRLTWRRISRTVEPPAPVTRLFFSKFCAQTRFVSNFWRPKGLWYQSSEPPCLGEVLEQFQPWHLMAHWNAVYYTSARYAHILTGPSERNRNNVNTLDLMAFVGQAELSWTQNRSTTKFLALFLESYPKYHDWVLIHWLKHLRKTDQLC